MGHRLSVRLPDDLAQGIDAFALRSGKTKSEIVRNALRRAGLSLAIGSQSHSLLMERAAALRTRQMEVIDAAALVRKVRGESP